MQMPSNKPTRTLLLVLALLMSACASSRPVQVKSPPQESPPTAPGDGASTTPSTSSAPPAGASSGPTPAPSTGGPGAAPVTPAPLPGFAYVRDARPGLMIPCAGAPRTIDNPRGLRENHHRSEAAARAFYRRHYQRAERHGVARVVWHMPAGWVEQDGMRGSIAVLDAMGERARPFLEEARAFKARNPGATVGVYLSGQMPVHYLASDEALAAQWEPYVHDRADHRSLLIDRVIAPLVEAGFTEFWFDHTSNPEYRADVLKLFQSLRERFGVHCVMEALPRRTDGSLDAEVMRQTASGALHRFMTSLWKGDPWPEGAEVNVILSTHGGVEPAGAAEIERYRAAGAVLWSMNERYDELIGALSRQAR